MKIFKTIFIFVVFGFIGAVLAGVWFAWNLTAVKGQAVNEFVIEQGEGVNQVSARLYEAGVIKSKLVFETYLYLRGWEPKIKAGEYDFPSASIVEVSDILVKGAPERGVKVTFIEGWTLKDIAQKLEEKGILSAEDFMDKVQKPKANGFTQDKYPVLYSKPDTVDLEGYLFPDTYRFKKGTDVEKVVGTMLDNLLKKFTPQMAADMDRQGKTLHEILTMASILEKEVRSLEDKKIVAGILWKRIEIGMPLQVDATVNYITGGKKPSVTIDETKIDNPFNTYMYKGLPPGPISNPGLESIIAAIYPEKSDYLFYLTSPDGKVIYSKTFEEHVKNKNKYLK